MKVWDFEEFIRENPTVSLEFGTPIQSGGFRDTTQQPIQQQPTGQEFPYGLGAYGQLQQRPTTQEATNFILRKNQQPTNQQQPAPAFSKPNRTPEQQKQQETVNFILRKQQ